MTVPRRAQVGSFIAVSRSTARDLEELYKIPPALVTVSHNRVAPIFRPGTRPTSPAQRVLTAPPMPPVDADAVARYLKAHGVEQPYFLLVGARYDYKQTDTLFKAMQADAALKRRATVVLMGGGSVNARVGPAATAADHAALTAAGAFLTAQEQPHARGVKVRNLNYVLREDQPVLYRCACSAMPAALPAALTRVAAGHARSGAAAVVVTSR